MALTSLVPKPRHFRCFAVDDDMSRQKASTMKPPPAAIQLLPTPRKGKADWREYRPFRLDNGVTCMAVHDPESKVTAVTASVNVGAAADPRELSGLAHFAEHMCFLGSEKYPGENEYKRYLSTHGGRSNGSTSLHLTTYKFDVLAEHAETAVDIFSHFFTCPLFSASGTSREVNAVDSENSKNLTADIRRRLQILKALADPDHYYSKFTTGNVQTLPVDRDVDRIRDALLAFHQYHYRPENLTVVIVGPQSLDTLQSWLVPRFSSMMARTVTEETDAHRLIALAAEAAPNYAHDQPPPQYRPAFFKQLQGGTWPVLLTIKPVKSMRKLVLNFPMPSTRYMSDKNPASVLSHLLGHEGPGSPFAALQNEGLITSLSSGSRISGPDQTLFQVEMGLTEQGEERWEEVVDLIMAHCRLINETAVDAKKNPEGTANHDLRRIWGELATLGAMAFEQTSPSAAYDFAPSLVQSMIKVGTEKCLADGRMLNETPDTFPLEQFVDFSSLLVADNCIVERCSLAAWEKAEKFGDKEERTGFGKQTEKWYGIDYFLTSIDPGVIQGWDGAPTNSYQAIDHTTLHLPGPNLFIPRTLELCDELPPEAKLGPRIEKEIDPPNLLINEAGFGRLWHRLDDRYALPKATLTLLLRNAAVENVLKYGTWQHDVDASIRSSMLSDLFRQALKQETYDADLAGLSWSVATQSTGITLSCGGFSDRLPDLALKVLSDFLLPEKSEVGADVFFKDTFFQSTKDRLVRGLSTYFEAHRADVHAQYYSNLLMSSESNGIESSLASVEAATLQSLRDHHRCLLQNEEMEIECLFSGNVAESQAKDFYNRASEIVREAIQKANHDFSGTTVASGSQTVKRWIPGPFERRLEPGDDIELHFASKNPEEENGAVLMVYQSQIPGFKGESISLPQCLRSSASIRLLCHMLREPLFTDLRTKQQLGYIVSSSYDLGFSGTPPFAASEGPMSVPIEFITINVLSRKVPPPEVKLRIDEFLDSFRETLLNMPESEIRHHADALGKKLLKPIQKLGTEAANQFAKIRRYAPEVLGSGGTDKDLPWESIKDLAREIQSLNRHDLVENWDRMVAKSERSRVVSCVYGKTFPLESSLGTLPSHAIVNNVDDLVVLRSGLKPFDNSVRSFDRRGGFARSLGTSSRTTLGLTAAAVVGAAVIGWSTSRRTKK